MKQLFTFLAVLLAIPVLGQGTVILGTDTTFNGIYEHPTPYGTHYNNLRIQYLVRSGELSGLGLAAGEITAIAFNVHAPNNCSPMPDFTIRIKQTAVNELSETFDNEGLTTVFSSP
jgi:hypothetical protein